VGKEAPPEGGAVRIVGDAKSLVSITAVEVHAGRNSA